MGAGCGLKETAPSRQNAANTEGLPPESGGATVSKSKRFGIRCAHLGERSGRHDEDINPTDQGKCEKQRIFENNKTEDYQ